MAGSSPAMTVSDYSLSRTRMRVRAVGMDRVVAADRVSDANRPSADRWSVRQVKAAIPRAVAVGIDSDIRDRESISNQKRSIGKAAV
jgi:hypothetical protein